MRKIISLICFLMPLIIVADELQLQENAPQRYVVVKGDTLWDISARFFKNPWKWPEIWGYNKDTIKDPHWIYPGDVVFLDPGSKTLRVESSAPAETAAPTDAVSPAPTDETATSENIVKLSPKARELPRTREEAVPVISLKTIGPFLSRPLVIEEDELDNAPILAGTFEQREILGTDDIAYVENLPENKGSRWQIFRPDRVFEDPDTGEVLGHEVVYLGDATVEQFGQVASLRITRSVQEIHKGDRFAQATSDFDSSFIPHKPGAQIDAKVISIYGGVQQAGQNAVVTLNKGRRDGLEVGHILSLFQKGEEISRPGLFSSDLVLPDVRYGTLFVFRVFEKVSYALVMETKLPVQILDRASTPN